MKKTFASLGDIADHFELSANCCREEMRRTESQNTKMVKLAQTIIWRSAAETLRTATIKEPNVKTYNFGSLDDVASYFEIRGSMEHKEGEHATTIKAQDNKHARGSTWELAAHILRDSAIAPPPVTAPVAPDTPVVKLTRVFVIERDRHSDTIKLDGHEVGKTTYSAHQQGFGVMEHTRTIINNIAKEIGAEVHIVDK